MFRNLIAHRVWKAIKAKIRAAQKVYEDGCKQFEIHRDEEIKQAEALCERSKVDLADRLVNQIIG